MATRAQRSIRAEAIFAKPARYVAITTKGGTLVHEGTFYKSVADIEKAGIKASLVPGAHPWGRREDGF